MLFRQRSERAGDAIQLRINFVQRRFQLQNEAGIDGILARRTPMHVARRVRIIFRHQSGELLYERNGEIAGARRGTLARDGRVNQIGAAFRCDRRSRRLWE